MELFMSEVGKYFIAERDGQRQRVIYWLKITESARSVYSNVTEFEQGYNDICEYVKSQLFSNEDCTLAFDRQSVKLNELLNKRRLAIRQRYNNIRRKILRLKEKLFPGTSNTHDTSEQPTDNCNEQPTDNCNSEEDEFISSTNATPFNDGVGKDLPTLPNKVQNQNTEEIQQNDYVAALNSNTITPFRLSASMLGNTEDTGYENNETITTKSPAKNLFTPECIIETEADQGAQTQVTRLDEGTETEGSEGSESVDTIDEDYIPTQKGVQEEIAACESSIKENNANDFESESSSVRDSDISSDSETCGDKRNKTKRRKTNDEETNCPLLASQRIDESIDSLSSIVVKNLKFYVNLLSDHDPYIKCGFSSMDDVKVTNQYTRDRICTATIFVNLKHNGPGVNLLYDSILKYRLREFLYHPSPNEEEAIYKDLRMQIIESARELDNNAIAIANATEYVADKHELYWKTNSNAILEIMLEIAAYSLQDLKEQGFIVEALKNIKPCKSRFMTQRYKSNHYKWWTQDDLKIYEEGIEATASFGSEAGGSLPLNCNGVANLGIWLTNMHAGFLGFEEFVLSDADININILWVGIGFAEEAVLLCKQLRFLNPNISLHIYGLELHKDAADAGLNIVHRHGCDENISIFVTNVLHVDEEFCTTNLPERIDIVYTSGAFHELINFKLISLAVKLRAVLLCSKGTADTVKHLYTNLDISKQNRPLLCVHAELYHSKTDTAVPESRQIFICKYPHNHLTNQNIFDYAIESYTCDEKSIKTEIWFIRLLEKMRAVNSGSGTMELDKESGHLIISVDTGFFSDFLIVLEIDADNLKYIMDQHQENQRTLKKTINELAESFAARVTEEVDLQLRRFLYIPESDVHDCIIGGAIESVE